MHGGLPTNPVQGLVHLPARLNFEKKGQGRPDLCLECLLLEPKNSEGVLSEGPTLDLCRRCAIFFMRSSAHKIQL